MERVIVREEDCDGNLMYYQCESTEVANALVTWINDLGYDAEIVTDRNPGGFTATLDAAELQRIQSIGVGPEQDLGDGNEDSFCNWCISSEYGTKGYMIGVSVDNRDDGDW